MQAARLRQRITFESQSSSKDSFGQPVQSWSTVLTCWAAVEPLSGRELMAARQVASEITHRVIVRYQAALAVPRTVMAYRVNFGGRYFDIREALNVEERDREVHLLCVERRGA